MLKVRFRADLPGRALAAVALALPAGREPPGPLRAAARAAGFGAGAPRALVLPGAPATILAGAGEGRRAADWERAGGLAMAAWLAIATAPAGGDAPVPDLAFDARGLGPEAAAALAAGACLRAWDPPARRRVRPPARARRITLAVDDPPAAGRAWARAEAGVRGCLYARDLVAEPANALTPRAFARRLRRLGRHGLEVSVLKRREVAALGLGGLEAVARASAQPPRLVVLRWPGTLPHAPVAFVGKGLTFDTGGVCIKPAAGMEAMRADMAGAAACAGAMLALALRRSPAPAVAVLAIAENMTGAAAYRPGDVLRMGSGRTVEVVDTDAEGRLVLADALHHAASFAPRAVLDVATLTGAIVAALGHHHAGLFGTDPALLARAVAAGEAVGERLWPMPIGARHREDLDSAVADLRQCAAGRLQPDACHAAAFLREFAGPAPWAHLDIAGVEARAAAGPPGPKGATGFGARLLDRLVETAFELPD